MKTLEYYQHYFLARRERSADKNAIQADEISTFEKIFSKDIHSVLKDIKPFPPIGNGIERPFESHIFDLNAVLIINKIYWNHIVYGYELPIEIDVTPQNDRWDNLPLSIDQREPAEMDKQQLDFVKQLHDYYLWLQKADFDKQQLGLTSRFTKTELAQKFDILQAKNWVYGDCKDFIAIFTPELLPVDWKPLEIGNPLLRNGKPNESGIATMIKYFSPDIKSKAIWNGYFTFERESIEIPTNSRDSKETLRRLKILFG